QTWCLGWSLPPKANTTLRCLNTFEFNHYIICVQDLLFSACGLSILSTIICTLSTVTCSIHIFSLDLMHLLAPHRSRSVNPECTTPQDAFLSNMMDFEEFVPPIPPPPYYPPEYTCSSETDAQSVTYNGSMGSPVPLYPTDCPPPYEAVIGQRAPSQVHESIEGCKDDLFKRKIKLNAMFIEINDVL
uniref:Uncharacterized protein n=1 Tax=Sinocyclocheilus grahami TaxID=75366 RepID=A0A672L041_SINGR